MGSDQRLREFERRARSGDPQAEAEQLVQRVRSGALSRERLELAAYLGHPPARVAHGDSIFGAGAEAGIVDLEAWVRGLDHRRAGRWPLAPLRAALAATRAALPASPCCPNHDDISGENFAAGCPSWPMTEAAIADAERCLAGEALTDRLPASAHGMTMDSAGYHLAEALWDFQCGHTRGSPNQTTCAWFEVERCAQLAGEAFVRDAIRTELVSWALGGSP